MGKDSVELSKAFEARAREFAALVRELDDEEWQALCVAENWSVGTTAHHVGAGMNATWGVAQAMVAGNAPALTWDDLHAMNAAHAAEFPNPDREETLALIERSAGEVAAAIAALENEALDRTAVLPAFGDEPLSVRSWLELVVVGHFDMHRPSIEAATGR